MDLQAVVQVFAEERLGASVQGGSHHVNIGTALRHVKTTAEQFKDFDRWRCPPRYISDRIVVRYRAAQAARGCHRQDKCRIQGY